MSHLTAPWLDRATSFLRDQAERVLLVPDVYLDPAYLIDAHWVFGPSDELESSGAVSSSQSVVSDQRAGDAWETRSTQSGTSIDPYEMRALKRRVRWGKGPVLQQCSMVSCIYCSMLAVNKPVLHLCSFDLVLLVDVLTFNVLHVCAATHCFSYLQNGVPIRVPRQHVTSWYTHILPCWVSYNTLPAFHCRAASQQCQWLGGRMGQCVYR